MDKEKDIMKMTESELSDYIDELIIHKIEHQEIPEYATIDMVYRDIYKHMRFYFRVLQLQLNFIKAKADLGKYFGIAISRFMGEKERKLLMDEVERLKNKDNEATLKERRKLRLR